MNTKIFLVIFYLLINISLLQAMEQQLDLTIKATAGRLTTFKETARCSDATTEKRIGIDIRSFKMLVLEAHEQMRTANLDPKPLRQLLGKLRGKKIELNDKLALTWITPKDFFHRLCPYIIYIGQPLKVYELNPRSVEPRPEMAIPVVVDERLNLLTWAEERSVEVVSISLRPLSKIESPKPDRLLNLELSAILAKAAL